MTSCTCPGLIEMSFTEEEYPGSVTLPRQQFGSSIMRCMRRRSGSSDCISIIGLASRKASPPSSSTFPYLPLW